MNQKSPIGDTERAKVIFFTKMSNKVVMNAFVMVNKKSKTCPLGDRVNSQSLMRHQENNRGQNR